MLFLETERLILRYFQPEDEMCIRDRLYSCWKRFPSKSGILNQISCLRIFPEVMEFSFITFIPFPF